MTPRSISPESQLRGTLLTFRSELLNRGLVAVRQTPPDVRPVIERSWRRTVGAGLDPQLVPTVYDDSFDPDSPLLHAANNVLDQLTSLLADTAASLLLADNQGRIIARRGVDASVRARLDQMNAREGFVYAESTLGTNGVGTSIEERRPVIVEGAEHFLDGLHNLTCAAVPLISPVHNRTIGSLSLVIPSGHDHALALPLLAQASDEIHARVRRLLIRADDPTQSIFSQEVKHDVVPGVVLDSTSTLLNGYASYLLEPTELHRLRTMRTAVAETPAVQRVVISDQEYNVHVNIVRIPAPNAVVDERILIAKYHPVADDTASVVDAPCGKDTTSQPTWPSARGQAFEKQIGDDFPKYLDRLPFSLIRSQISAALRSPDIEVHGEPNTGRHRIAAALQEIPLPSGDKRRVQIVSVGSAPGTGIHDGFSKAHEPAASEETLASTPQIISTVPLRYMSEVIPTLVRQEVEARSETSVQLAAATVNALRELDWTENFKALATVVDSVTTHLQLLPDSGSGLVVTPEMLPEQLATTKAQGFTYLENLERQSILDTLRRFDNNKSRAAEFLGLSRNTLYRRMRRYRIAG